MNPGRNLSAPERFDRQELDALHKLRVAGLTADRPAALEGLVASGYVIVSQHGVLLTEAGHERHEQLLAVERETIDIAALRQDFEAFIAIDPAVKARVVALQVLRSNDLDGRRGQRLQLQELAGHGIAAFERTARQLPCFQTYGPRLLAALDRLAAGERRFLADPREDSFHTVWMEAHEDYVVTLGDPFPEEEE
ncbi:MAG: hypothetical protein ACOYD4_00525 [Solirubrobacterales bacterium]